MSSNIGSFFIRVVNLKRLVSGTKEILSDAETRQNEALQSWASKVQQLLQGSVYYVGIPDESYPTRYLWKELSLEGMDDAVTIRMETERGLLDGLIATSPNLTIEGKSLADLVFRILKGLRMEEYHGKTHQVASFDPLGERLGFYP